MSKVTGKPIKFGEAQALRALATGFQAENAIKNAVPNASAGAQVFYNNLDCAFIFDKGSLDSLMAKIVNVPNSGLVMMMGASNDPARLNRPTLSVFACTINKLNDTYAIIHPDPNNKPNTDGVEHPGLVALKNGGGDTGVIEVLTI